MTATVSYIFLALAAAGQSILGGTALSSPTLVFEFPDGVRGGYGKIQGTAPMPDVLSPDFKLEQSGPDFSLEQIRKCGAPDARYSDVERSHGQIIVAASTDHDREIVKCVKRSVPFHFSVSVFAKESPGTDIPFQEFWSSPPTPADKVQ
ncbi:hypothetical protein [Sphingopyxis sp. H115]|uniref:hypothetical protein n=1 Tax=Sphingopyxis sp. H115 TaxID=1759073 RepID=UPI000737039E|nr:hypothetical protein [Sphingopyxis sp. H115]KTE07093.1 hypothetical protein ATE71_15905 [Sphingopyxis sp. H115]